MSKNYIPSPKTLFTDLSIITFNWLVLWKITWGIWRIFTKALQSLKIGILIESFNPKLKKYDPQRNYLWWHWRMTQNLKRNWLAISKLTLGIWRILTRALETLKNFHFNGLLLSKVFIVWAKQVQRIYLSWYWKVVQNLERNRLVVSKSTYIRNLTNFDLSTRKPQKCSL